MNTGKKGTKRRARRGRPPNAERARQAYPVMPEQRIRRDVLLNTERLGPVLDAQSIAFAARELLFGLYGIDSTIYPFGYSQFELRVYKGTDLMAKQFGSFFVKQMSELFTWSFKRRIDMMTSSQLQTMMKTKGRKRSP